MKNNNCCCRFLLFVVLSVMSVNLQAQSDSLLQNSDLKRHNFRLAIDTSNGTNDDEEESVIVLKKEQLQTMLSYEQFQSYKMARRCYIASIPLLVLSGCGTAITTTFVGMGIYNYFSDGKLGYGSMTVMFYFLAGCTFAGTLAPLIPTIVLFVHSAKRLNNIAEDYNKQRHRSYFQNGLQLNYGFVGNGVGFQLRF